MNIVNYCAVIGDIKYSKALEDRSLVQDKLNQALIYINSKYKTGIAANFLITLGDEFQGLLIDADNLLDIIQYIQRIMFPVEIRFGVGLGKITTKINMDAAIGADGPAFWAARDAITRIHSDEQCYKKQAPDAMIDIYFSNSYRIQEINTMLSMMKSIESNWSQGVRLTIWDMLTHNDTQAECAKRLNINKSTVTKRLTQGNYYVYTKAIDVIKGTIVLLKEELDES